jgi:hypothetical protein
LTHTTASVGQLAFASASLEYCPLAGSVAALAGAADANGDPTNNPTNAAHVTAMPSLLITHPPKDSPSACAVIWCMRQNANCRVWSPQPECAGLTGSSYMFSFCSTFVKSRTKQFARFLQPK